MGRPRKPLIDLLLTGAVAHNRKRYQNRLGEQVEGNGPLGPPPDYFDALHLEVWDELVDDAPEGVLRLSDTAHVELTVRLLCKLRVWQVYGPRTLDFFESKMKERGVSCDEEMKELRAAFGCIIGCSTQELRLLADCLRSLGMTPKDRSKVTPVVQRREA